MPPEWELIAQWLCLAHADLRAAEADLAQPTPLVEDACFHCQQAVEKSLKAYLIHRDIEFQWSHEIKYLLGLCIQGDGSFEQLRDSAVPLTDYAVRFRYPSDQPGPTVEQSREALHTARRVYRFVLERLPVETHPAG